MSNLPWYFWVNPLWLCLGAWGLGLVGLLAGLVTGHEALGILALALLFACPFGISHALNRLCDAWAAQDNLRVQAAEAERERMLQAVRERIPGAWDAYAARYGIRNVDTCEAMLQETRL